MIKGKERVLFLYRNCGIVQKYYKCYFHLIFIYQTQTVIIYYHMIYILSSITSFFTAEMQSLGSVSAIYKCCPSSLLSKRKKEKNATFSNNIQSVKSSTTIELWQSFIFHNKLFILKQHFFKFNNVSKQNLKNNYQKTQSAQCLTVVVTIQGNIAIFGKSNIFYIFFNPVVWIII